MIYLPIVTSLMLIQLFYFGFKVGLARGKYRIEAPAVSGNEHFERLHRIHQNTMEQLVITIPSMWMFAQFFNANIAAGLGLVFIIGRFIYASAYQKSPESRGTGFLICAIPTGVLMIGSLIGGIIELLNHYQIL